MHYQDETQVFKNMKCTKVQKDIVGESTSGTFTVRSGRGERSILSHIGFTKKATGEVFDSI